MHARTLALSVGAIVACVALSNLLWKSLPTRAPTIEDVNRNAAPDPKVHALLQRVDELEHRLALQETRPRAIGQMASPEGAPSGAASAGDAPHDDAAHFQHLSDVISSTFEAQSPDGTAVEVERAVMNDFQGKHVVLSSVRCKSSICRLEVRMPTPDARKELDDLLGSGSLAHGAFTFAKPDGTGTIVFIGTPGAPLSLKSLGL